MYPLALLLLSTIIIVEAFLEECITLHLSFRKKKCTGNSDAKSSWKDPSREITNTLRALRIIRVDYSIVFPSILRLNFGKLPERKKGYMMYL